MRITRLIKDMNYAAERAMQLRMGLGGVQVTAAGTWHEPTAAQRAAGSPVRRRGILASALRRSS